MRQAEIYRILDIQFTPSESREMNFGFQQPSSGGWENANRALKALSGGRENANRAPKAPSEGWENANRAPKALSEGRENANRAPKALSEGRENTNRAPKALSEGWEKAFARRFPSSEASASSKADGLSLSCPSDAGAGCPKPVNRRHHHIYYYIDHISS